MNITNTTSFSSSVQALSNKTPAKNQQAKTVAPNEKQVAIEKSPQRIDNNKKAIALLEKQVKQNIQKESSTNTINNSNKINVDQPIGQNLNAVNAYQSVNNLAQRESIQSMLGVDLFA
ncbi:MAG: hypothetical protein JKX78_11945 [Alteromonadaceae bacterium]|nr:hypothetical protein [Alteromonadaceae bacterium]